MRKGKVQLKAYFRKNLGDDMFLRCIANRYPEITFRVYSHPRYFEAFKSINNMTAIPYYLWLWDRALEKIGYRKIWYPFFEKYADAVIHIGGSIFIEPEGFVLPDKVRYPHNIFYIGCNFGPYKTESYYKYIYRRLHHSADVCFRDSYSYDKFKELENVRSAPDVLFGYKEYPAYTKGEGVGISVIELEYREGLEQKAEKYYTTIAKMIDLCMEKQLKVKLFGFCIEEGDKTAISRIMELVKNKNIDVYIYDGNIDTFLDAINSCEYIIASRFHAMIIGWALRKKVFPVVYSRKQLNVMNDVHYTGDYWDLKESIDRSAEILLNECLKVNMIENIEDYVHRAEEQFAGADSYIDSMKRG